MLVFVVFAVLQLSVGWYYKDSCPMNWRIPQYLFVAGAVGLIKVLLNIGESFVSQCVTASTPDRLTTVWIILAACSACGVALVKFFITLFLVGWSIAGCVWIFSAWRHVQYINERESNYCNPILYRFAYWLLLAPFLYLPFLCVCAPLQAQYEAAR